MRYLLPIIIGLIAPWTSCMDASRDMLNITLNVNEHEGIKEVILTTPAGADTLQRMKSRTVRLRCPLKGEGTYTLCVYRKADTLCTGPTYAEGGYHPKWVLQGDSLHLLRSF